MKRTFNVACGRRQIPLELDDGRVCLDLQPGDIPPAPEVAAEVGRALDGPVDSPPLRELVGPDMRAVVIGDDLTRATPTDRILPVVLDELNAGGLGDDRITCVIATGTHRPMTDEEIAAKYGPAVTGRIRVVNHDCQDEADLVSCGTTRRGTDIRVNRTVLEADVRIGVGNIVPHMPTGWSGGAKILLPGVAGAGTTGQVHLLGATELQLGKVATPCREEMEDFAASVGLEFIVNTVLDRRDRLVRAVAGHFVGAHRQGVRWAERVFGAPFDTPANIVLASTAPIDFDLFQAGKGLFSAVRCTAAGGEIVLLSPLHEGVAPTHTESLDLGLLDDEELWRLARSGDHDVLSITSLMYFNVIKRHCRVTLATEGLSAGDAARMGFGRVRPDEFPQYLARRLADEPDATVGFVRNSVEILPLPQS